MHYQSVCPRGPAFDHARGKNCSSATNIACSLNSRPTPHRRPPPSYKLGASPGCSGHFNVRGWEKMVKEAVRLVVDHCNGGGDGVAFLPIHPCVCRQIAHEGDSREGATPTSAWRMTVH